MPRTGLSSQEVQEKAIRIAVENIRRHGIEKFRLSDIARRLKVSHTALYNHFPDKAALLDLISERWLNRIDASLDEVARRDLPPRKLIVAWFLEYHRLKLGKVLTDPEIFKTLNLAEEANKPFIFEHLRTMHGQLLFLLEKAVAAGELQVASPETAARILEEATLPFLHPRFVWEHKEEQREALLEQVVAAILAGLSDVA